MRLPTGMHVDKRAGEIAALLEEDERDPTKGAVAAGIKRTQAARVAGALHYSGKADEIAERLEAGEATAHAERLVARAELERRANTAVTREELTAALTALARLGG